MSFGGKADIEDSEHIQIALVYVIQCEARNGCAIAVSFNCPRCCRIGSVYWSRPEETAYDNECRDFIH
jgi:hypothetical protein